MGYGCAIVSASVLDINQGRFFIYERHNAYFPTAGRIFSSNIRYVSTCMCNYRECIKIIIITLEIDAIVNLNSRSCHPS